MVRSGPRRWFRVVSVIALMAVAAACEASWPTLGFGPDRDSNNPFESNVGVDNVSQLAKVWSSQALPGRPRGNLAGRRGRLRVPDRGRSVAGLRRVRHQGVLRICGGVQADVDHGAGRVRSPRPSPGTSCTPPRTARCTRSTRSARPAARAHRRRPRPSGRRRSAATSARPRSPAAWCSSDPTTPTGCSRSTRTAAPARGRTEGLPPALAHDRTGRSHTSGQQRCRVRGHRGRQRQRAAPRPLSVRRGRLRRVLGLAEALRAHAGSSRGTRCARADSAHRTAVGSPGAGCTSSSTGAAASTSSSTRLYEVDAATGHLQDSTEFSEDGNAFPHGPVAVGGGRVFLGDAALVAYGEPGLAEQWRAELNVSSPSSGQRRRVHDRSQPRRLPGCRSGRCLRVRRHRSDGLLRRHPQVQRPLEQHLRPDRRPERLRSGSVRPAGGRERHRVRAARPAVRVPGPRYVSDPRS